MSVFCLGFSACKTSKQKKRKPKAITAATSKEPYLLLYFQKTPCFGKCPNYEAEFWSDGRLLYNGINHVPLTGRLTYILPEKTIQNIQTEAKKIKYFSFKEKYLSNATDLPSTISRLTLDGKTKQIETQFSSDAPELVVKFQQNIHEEVMAILAEQEPYKPQK
ncbi:DUF6438 domain-containing protein [Flexibacter flexilis]|uniref:DUF6438 domain-containing protein n=1 Tax=Flexibacter flexilis TaxID=998 RepID=UPI0011602AAE|nr:DUF6438 domain-containing protein [Flexibacter flexilis]